MDRQLPAWVGGGSGNEALMRLIANQLVDIRGGQQTAKSAGGEKSTNKS